MPWLGGTCRDARYPALAGDWAVGCFGGPVNRAVNLETGQQVELERAVDSPGLADGVLIGAAGWWHLPSGTPTDKPSPVEAIGPFSTDGQRAVVTTPVSIEILDGNTRESIEAAPTPWRAPAIGDGFVAWVEDEVVMMAPEDGAAVQWAEGRHVSANGPTIAWLDDERVCLQRVGAMKQCTWTDAHTARGLSLDGDVACWESWNGEDVDIACSDGFGVDGPGHQRGPSRSEGWLLYRENGQTRLVRLPVAAPDPASE